MNKDANKFLIIGILAFVVFPFTLAFLLPTSILTSTQGNWLLLLATIPIGINLFIIWEIISAVRKGDKKRAIILTLAFLMLFAWGVKYVLN